MKLRVDSETAGMGFILVLKEKMLMSYALPSLRKDFSRSKNTLNQPAAISTQKKKMTFALAYPTNNILV